MGEKIEKKQIMWILSTIANICIVMLGIGLLIAESIG